MSKFLKLALILFFIGIITIAIALGYEYATQGTISADPFVEREESQSGSLQLEAFTHIDISTLAADIVIKEGTHWQLDYRLSDYETITQAEVIQNTLYITTEHERRSWIDYLKVSIQLGASSHAVVLTVPRGSQFQDVSLTTSSGDIEADTLETNTLFAKTSSGEIDIAYIEAPLCELYTISGNIEVDRLNTAEGTAESSSGEIDVEQSTADSLQVKTISGNIDIEGAVGNLITYTSSGETHVEGIFSAVMGESISGNYKLQGSLTEDSRIETTSGNVHVELTRLPTIEVDTTSGSSKINGVKDYALFIEGAPRLEITTISGNVRVQDTP